jgi:hypothetical protein
MKVACYDLVKTGEMEFQVGDETVRLTIEIFRNQAKPHDFYARIWDCELFRLRPTFPQGTKGKPVRWTDEPIRVERSPQFLARAFMPSEVKDGPEAFRKIVRAIKLRYSAPKGKPAVTEKKRKRVAT